MAESEQLATLYRLEPRCLHIFILEKAEIRSVDQTHLLDQSPRRDTCQARLLQQFGQLHSHFPALPAAPCSAACYSIFCRRGLSRTIRAQTARRLEAGGHLPAFKCIQARHQPRLQLP
jgi:hypothetical protein